MDCLQLFNERKMIFLSNLGLRYICIFILEFSVFAARIYQLETIQDVLPAQVESYHCSNDKIMKTKKGLMQRPTVMCY